MKDGPKHAAFHVSAMVRHNHTGLRLLRMLQDLVSSGRMINAESGTTERLDQRSRFDRGQAVHAASADTLIRSVRGMPGAS